MAEQAKPWVNLGGKDYVLAHAGEIMAVLGPSCPEGH